MVSKILIIKKIYLLAAGLILSTVIQGQVPNSFSESDTSYYIELTLFSNPQVSLDTVPLEVTLEFDMKLLRKNKYRETYQDAILKFVTYPDNIIEREVMIRSRGNFRKSYCDFPPIKLKLSKDRYDSENLNDLRKLKLITHCKKSRTYEQYLLKEYLVYKLYNILTDFSYRARLLVLNYSDVSGKQEPYTKYGFFTESDASLSNRMNSVEIERTGIGKELTDRDRFIQLALFQFMIGNTDWVIPSLHNIKLFKEYDVFRLQPVAVPYDFDYCGLVNTHYAIPGETLGIKSVTERVYMGYPIPEDEYYSHFERFIELKDAFYYLVENFDLLEPRHKKSMLKYLDEFYKIIEDRPLTRSMIISKANNIN